MKKRRTIVYRGGDVTGNTRGGAIPEEEAKARKWPRSALLKKNAIQRSGNRREDPPQVKEGKGGLAAFKI